MTQETPQHSDPPRRARWPLVASFASSGDILRVGVPDVARYLRSWLNQSHEFAESVRPGRPTLFLAVQEVFYSCGHRTMYDFEALALLCRAAGFEVIEQRDFGDSRLSPCPDSEHRQPETIYVKAVK